MLYALGSLCFTVFLWTVVDGMKERKGWRWHLFLLKACALWPWAILSVALLAWRDGKGKK